jgi:HAE1 family hydrophobic/amphiphilic exporter-1
MGKAFSHGQAVALREAEGMVFPAGYEVRSGSAAFELVSSLSSLASGLALAVLLIYVVLVVQFESLLWPLLILTTIPMTIAGPALALTICGFPVSLLVLFGALVLVGIVVNNAILMVASIDSLRAEGVPCTQAIIEGARIRLRPVVVSTVTTLVGTFPMLLDRGTGSSLWAPFALTLAAGLIIAAVASLVLTPAMYLALANLKRRLRTVPRGMTSA